MAGSTVTPGDLATPHLVGGLMNWGLYGVLGVQVYLYYLAFPNDRLFMKILVYSLFVLETLQTAIVGHDVIVALGTGYADTTMLDNVHLTWLSVPILSSIMSASVQMFFAWRIRVLSESLVMAGVISLISLFQCAGGIAQGIISFPLEKLSLVPGHTKITTVIWFVGAAVCDVMIAVCMSYYLSSKKTGVKRMDAFLTRLVRLSIETGTLTAIIAVIDATLVLGLPNDDFFVTPSYVLAKLYTNSFMVILNSRMHITNGRNDPPVLDPSLQMTTVSIPNWTDSQIHSLRERNVGRAARVERITIEGMIEGDDDASGSTVPQQNPVGLKRLNRESDYSSLV